MSDLFGGPNAFNSFTTALLPTTQDDTKASMKPGEWMKLYLPPRPVSAKTKLIGIANLKDMTLDASTPLAVLTSPKSIRACLQEGVDPRTLLKRASINCPECFSQGESIVTSS